MPDEQGHGRQRVVLHVGVPKSGTTFLQASLAENREALRDAGVLYPNKAADLTFRAALDVRGNHKAWGRRRSEVEGAWDELCRRARQYLGHTVISQELLAAASGKQITRAMTMLRGLETHVVLTVRDPAHQLVSEWQEGIKHGRRASFEEFAATVLAEDADHPHARRFLAAQDLPAVLARWADHVPADRVHVVACPPGADREELWRLFGEAVGFDTTAFPPAGPGAGNHTLGVDQIALLRQVNEALDDRLRQPGYGRVVKHYFAQQLLAKHHSRRPLLPAELHEPTAVLGKRWVEAVERAGYRVHGELGSLMPALPARPPDHPDRYDEAAAARCAAAAIGDLLVEVDRLQSEVAELRSENKVRKKKGKRLKRMLAAALAS